MNLKTLKTSIVLLVILTLMTGVIYPLLVTGIAQLAFPKQANGSLSTFHGSVVGSELIGQQFTGAGYFRGRPSATPLIPYNAGLSSGSNLGPLNQVLLDSVRQRVQRVRNADSTAARPVPVDMVTSSASGLDPHISVSSALLQVPGVAHVRHLPEDLIRKLVDENTEGRQWNFLGEPRVNVLLLNIALDTQSRSGR
jgi:potassium-transporting ATPase KdpC subunit